MHLHSHAGQLGHRVGEAHQDDLAAGGSNRFHVVIVHLEIDQVGFRLRGQPGQERGLRRRVHHGGGVGQAPRPSEATVSRKGRTRWEAVPPSAAASSMRWRCLEVPGNQVKDEHAAERASARKPTGKGRPDHARPVWAARHGRWYRPTPWPAKPKSPVVAETASRTWGNGRAPAKIEREDAFGVTDRETNDGGDTPECQALRPSHRRVSPGRADEGVEDMTKPVTVIYRQGHDSRREHFAIRRLPCSQIAIDCFNRSQTPRLGKLSLSYSRSGSDFETTSVRHGTTVSVQAYERAVQLFNKTGFATCKSMKQTGTSWWQSYVDLAPRRGFPRIVPAGSACPEAIRKSAWEKELA